MMFSDRSNPPRLISPIVDLAGRHITTRFLRIGLLILASAISLDSAAARKHQQWGAELSVDMDTPYDRLVKIVQQVSEDGVIRGTAQYKGTTQLDAAKKVKTAVGFEAWKGQGVVFYKAQPNTLAPEHFHESGDQGIVEVRYVVEPAGANLSHLRIAAVFATNTGHGVHPSDGAVEDAEFSEISQKLQELQDQEKKGREEAFAKELEVKSDELRVQLERQRAQLNATVARQQQLERAVNDLEKGLPARIRTGSADLKAAPYNQSKTTRLLSRDEAVMVMEQTQHWYRVQTGSGEQGWVYRLMVEVPQ
jgi:cell division protein FtsB